MICHLCQSMYFSLTASHPLCPVCLRLLGQEYSSFSALPYHCPSCGVGSLCEEGFCFDCISASLNLSNQSLLSYKGRSKELFYRWKFGADQEMVHWFGTKVLSQIDIKRPTSLIPLPPNPRRIRQGGYDAVGDLACYLGGPMVKPKSNPLNLFPVLGRRSSRQQKELSKGDRGKQKDLYLKALPPKDHPILLIDDVLTTGFSLAQAYEILNNQGYKEIRSLTLFCRSY